LRRYAQVPAQVPDDALQSRWYASIEWLIRKQGASDGEGTSRSPNRREA
jgi:hypothetical protein